MNNFLQYYVDFETDLTNGNWKKFQTYIEENDPSTRWEINKINEIDDKNAKVGNIQYYKDPSLELIRRLYMLFLLQKSESIENEGEYDSTAISFDIGSNPPEYNCGTSYLFKTMKHHVV